MNTREQIHVLSEEMLENLGKLVAVDSQLGTPSEGKPFGEGPAEALGIGLEIARELGFKTVNLDNYCGYAEMGEGEEIVGIAGHLDIVPVGGDWTYDPFKLAMELSINPNTIQREIMQSMISVHREACYCKRSEQ